MYLNFVSLFYYLACADPCLLHTYIQLFKICLHRDLSSFTTKLVVVKVASLMTNDCEFLLLLHMHSLLCFCGNHALTYHKRHTHITINCRYSIENAVSDLKELVRSLDLNKFHILGHSFGGVVAFEYAKSSLEDDDQHHDCLSLTLSNAPSNMALSHEESGRLVKSINEEFMLENNAASDMPVSRIVNERFRKRHECRTENVPEPLVTAIQSRGLTFGPEAVRDYIAFPPATHLSHSSSPRSVNASNKLMPPVLLIRGEHDFVTEECIRGWRKIFTTDVTIGYREEVMNDCAHYCHLEDPQGFGELIKSHCFINDY